MRVPTATALTSQHHGVSLGWGLSDTLKRVWPTCDKMTNSSMAFLSEMASDHSSMAYKLELLKNR